MLLIYSLIQAHTTREHLAAEMISLPEKIKALRQSTETMSNLDILKSEGNTRKRELSKESDALRDKLVPTENAVKEATSKYRELQVHDILIYICN